MAEHETGGFNIRASGIISIPFLEVYPPFSWRETVEHFQSNGWLHYVLINALSRLGVNDVWLLRLPSLLFSLGTLYMVYRLGSLLHSRTLGLCGAFITAGNICLIAMSAHCRFYAMAVFMMMVSAYGMLSLVLKKDAQQNVQNRWLLLAAVGMAMSVSSMVLTAVPLFMLLILCAFMAGRRPQVLWRLAVVLLSFAAVMFILLWRDAAALDRVFYPDY
ncbi:glycosyltransferase family 39 protein, partial [bacterium]|nr:glycosyltransferase family 39 protein [bacterium]